MTIFRDAIASTTYLNPSTGAQQRLTPADADAVLAMPEMQAIKRWLKDDWNRWCCDACRSAFLDDLNVPASVREWVPS